MHPDFLGFCRELLVVAHLFSVHSVPGLNDQNPGVGLQCGTKRWSLAAGTYLNSFDQQSAYAVAGVDAFHFGVLRLGAVMGLASGYEHVRKLPVIGGARVTVRLGRIEIGVLAVPPVDQYVGFAHLTVSLQLR